MPKTWITLLAVAVLGLSCRCGGDTSDQSIDPQRSTDSQSIGTADQGVPDDAKTPTDDALNEAPDTANAQSDSGATDTGHASCVRSCAVSEKTDCPNKKRNCVARCELALTSVCGAEFRALLDCGVTKSLDEYQCDHLGASMLRPGVCTAEFAALNKCLGPK